MNYKQQLRLLSPKAIAAFAPVRAKIQAAIDAQPKNVSLKQALEQVRKKKK